MKDLVAKLKTADYRQLAIDHGERIGAGLIGLLLLVALLTTSWSSYPRAPEELTQKVSAARTAIAAGKWQDSQDAQSGFYSLSAGLTAEKVNLLLTDNETQRADVVRQLKDMYAFSTPLYRSLYRQGDPARQPELLPVEEPIVDAGRAIIAYRPASPEPVQVANESSDPREEERTRRLKDTFGSGRIEDEGDTANADELLAMQGGADYQESRCMRFVSVRGIVPLRRQVLKVASALSESSPSRVAGLVEYWDFRLERRSKPARGAQNWSDWEEVDVRTAREVLERAAGWDPELVDIAVTDPVFTMQLPTRVVYEWSRAEVSHPKVDNYILPREQRERQMDIVGQYLERQFEAARTAQQEQKGGLAPTQRGSGSSYTGMFRSGGPQSLDPSNLMGQLAQRLDQDNASKLKQELVDQFLQSQTASGRLLLFRYIDFDVRPATTYQYRVALKLKNPNYGRPPQQVIDPEITKAQYLETPMSAPTPAVTVPDDVQYFVTKVDDARGPNPPTATFDIYQWSTKYGTTINQQLKVMFGSFVGDRTKAEVFDPPRRQYLEEADVEFETRDVLVDVVDAPQLLSATDRDAHADLELPLEKLRRGLGVAEQALVVNQFGELVSFDPVSMSDAYAKTKRKLEIERRDLGGLKEAAEAAEAEDEGTSFEVYEDRFGGGEDEDSSRRSSRPNPLRKTSGY